MDKASFIEFMRAQKKSERTVARYAAYVEAFENYLSKCKQGRRLNETTLQDVRDFEAWGGKALKDINQYIWAIKAYAEYTSNYEMAMVANELLGTRYAAQYKLKDFKGVAPEDVKNLSLRGIKTVKQMLDAGSAKRDRKNLSEETGVPYERILELVKLSDLARIPGLRKVRARLYYDAGLDTVEKIANCDPGDLIKTLAGFIDRTGFNGIAPLRKEAATAVATAKYISKIVEY